MTTPEGGDDLTQWASELAEHLKDTPIDINHTPSRYPTVVDVLNHINERIDALMKQTIKEVGALRIHSKADLIYNEEQAVKSLKNTAQRFRANDDATAAPYRAKFGSWREVPDDDEAHP